MRTCTCSLIRMRILQHTHAHTLVFYLYHTRTQEEDPTKEWGDGAATVDASLFDDDDIPDSDLDTDDEGDV